MAKVKKRVVFEALLTLDEDVPTKRLENFLREHLCLYAGKDEIYLGRNKPVSGKWGKFSVRVKSV